VAVLGETLSTDVGGGDSGEPGVLAGWLVAGKVVACGQTNVEGEEEGRSSLFSSLSSFFPAPYLGYY
jgi:hypothetical protein